MSPEEEYYLELLRKMLEDRLSSEERETLYTMSESDSDKSILLRYLTIENETDRSRLEAEIIYEKTLPNDIISASTTPNKLSFIKRFRKYWYVAATICFGILFSSIWISSRDKTSSENIAEWEYITTRKGERKFFRMSDGTEIWLNSESSLKVKRGYGIYHRIMELNGEAYFSVVKNKKIPLHVKTWGTDIEVLGTIFNVRAYREEKKVATTLVEGKVKLQVENNNGQKEYTLKPGDKVEVVIPHPTENHNQNNTADPRINLVDYKKVSDKEEDVLELMWIKNKLVFNADSLPEMIKKMERWYNKTIIIQNEALKDQLFTGVFEEKTCEQVLDILQKTGVKLDYKIEKDTIYLQ